MVNRILDRRAFPVPDVVGLVAPGDENRLGIPDRGDDIRIMCRLAIREDDRLDRVAATECKDVVVVLESSPDARSTTKSPPPP
ncbi:MAG TPA: hypothetical protein VML92_02985 [Steroidobacteraceae bacterium]|nr:hypothetical protein [Steroidobacteraceae bacterium]